MRCTAAVNARGYLRLLRGASQIGERFLGIGIRIGNLNALEARSVFFFFCSSRLLEYPNPSVPDVYQELQPCTGIAYLPTFQHRGPFQASSVGKLLIQVPVGYVHLSA